MYPSVSIVIPIILTVLYYTPTPMRLVGGPATVIDGDTLVVADERVRLEGIDAPEADQTCRRAGERYPALRHRGNASAAVADRGWHCHVQDQRPGSGGPAGRLVSAGGSDGPRRVAGAAWACAGLSALLQRYSTQYVIQEDHARQERSGLWTGEFVAPWDWRTEERMDWGAGR